MQELVVGIEKTKDEKMKKMIISGLLYLSTNKVGYFPALKSFLQTQTKKKQLPDPYTKHYIVINAVCLSFYPDQ